MSYTILIEELAEKDIDEAFLWYELQKERLGFEFIAILDESFNKIKEFPFSFNIGYKKFRRTILKKFPNSIFFYIENQNIFISAVLHNSRNPIKWKERKISN